jgi:hypothetical protein
MTTGERCQTCHGFGHVSPGVDLDAIFRRTAAASLLISDRAAGL